MTNNDALISVIVPVYNVEDFLAKCVESIINQTYKNFEIILVDDGSSDDSGKICDDYADRYGNIQAIHKTNGGLSDARNRGLDFINGEYVTFIDSDDYIDEDYLEYLYTLLKKYDTKLSVCQLRFITSNENRIDSKLTGDVLLSGKDCLKRMLYHDQVDTTACAKLYHRSLFETIRYPVGKQFEDIGTTYKFFMDCSDIAVGFEAKYNYIFRRTSIVNCDFNIKKLDLLGMTDNMGKDVLEKYPDLESAVIRRRVYARFSTLNQMLRTKEYRDERNDIISFIKNNRRNILRDPNAPKRDKMGTVLLSLGYPIYRIVWMTYSMLK